MAEDGHKVTLNVYDLSQGLARQLSTTFLGKAIEAIWHTGIVVYGNEYYFGAGIQHAPEGQTQYGTPIRVIDLGVTHVPKEIFKDYLQEINPRYTAETYRLLSHNCNNFSNEVAQFLVGTTIPDYILQLPNEVINSPMGALMLPMIQQLETTLRSGAVPQALQFRPSVFNPQPSLLKTVKAPSHSSRIECQTIENTQVKDESPQNADTADVKPATAEEKKEPKVDDPLGEARRSVQDEITKEFIAIMATGTLCASEAVALATRRVMERHGRLNVPMQQ